MIKSQASDVKRERRKSLFLREITTLIQDLASQEVTIAEVYVSKLDISPNSGICYIYFSTFKEPGEQIYDAAIKLLKLYRPSLRRAFAKRVQTRYAPELIFVYDKAKEKERRMTELLNKVQEELAETENK